jgi:hypothetical protein
MTFGEQYTPIFFTKRLFCHVLAFILNDCVGVNFFHPVNRPIIDAKLLSRLVIEKIEADKKITFKLACQPRRLKSIVGSYRIQ